MEAAKIEPHLEIVGRTRFCIHPAESRKVPAVGGTKDLDWDKVTSLKPDLLVFDQEENPKKFAEESPIPFLATQVTSLESLQSELLRLATTLRSATLARWSAELGDFLQNSPSDFDFLTLQSQVLERKWADWTRPQAAYVIWQNPWMLVARDTFIGSVWSFLGVELVVPTNATSKYPEVKDEFLQSNYCLFSSEPFPFRTKSHEAEKFAGALVDGEKFSWFGVRTLRFLQALRNPEQGSTFF